MDRQTFSEIVALLRPLQRKIRNQVNRAVLALVDDSAGMQKTQASVLSGEVMDQEHMQPGGLTHVPIQGAEGLFVTVSGVRDDGVMICVSDRRYRPKGLQGGETALYNDAPASTQSKIILKLDGSIEVLPAPGKGVLIGGSAAAQAQVLGDVLKTVLSALTVTTAMGPSSTPVNAATFSTFLSTLHKIDS